jgi:nucleotide-binding universal stress UspA family protein
MKIGKILVPYDGSEHSKRAFRYALDLAKKYSSELAVASCILVQDQLPEASVPEEENLELQRQREIASKLLSVPEMESEEAMVPYKGVILKTSSVTDAILSYSESNDIDIIVVGSRGLGGFKKLLLGSVASALSQYSKCPVLIVK